MLVWLNLGRINVYSQVLSSIYFRRYLGAWPAFVLSLFYIGCLTAVVEQVGSSHASVNALYLLKTRNPSMGTLQGSHRLDKYLSVHNCLEKSLKMKFALEST